MSQENILLREITYTYKGKYFMFSLLYGYCLWIFIYMSVEGMLYNQTETMEEKGLVVVNRTHVT